MIFVHYQQLEWEQELMTACSSYFNAKGQSWLHLFLAMSHQMTPGNKTWRRGAGVNFHLYVSEQTKSKPITYCHWPIKFQKLQTMHEQCSQHPLANQISWCTCPILSIKKKKKEQSNERQDSWLPEGTRDGEKKQPTFYPPSIEIICIHLSIGTVSRAALERLLRPVRDGADYVWAFQAL